MGHSTSWSFRWSEKYIWHMTQNTKRRHTKLCVIFSHPWSYRCSGVADISTSAASRLINIFQALQSSIVLGIMFSYSCIYKFVETDTTDSRKHPIIFRQHNAICWLIADLQMSRIQMFLYMYSRPTTNSWENNEIPKAKWRKKVCAEEQIMYTLCG